MTLYRRLPFMVVCAGTVLLWGGLAPRAFPQDVEVLGAQEDITVTRSRATDTFTVDNAAISFSVGLDRTGMLLVQSLVAAGGREVLQEPVAVGALVIGGRHIDLADSRSARVALTSVGGAGRQRGFGLALAFDLADAGVTVTRYFLTYPRTPVIETWTDVASGDDGGEVTVSAPVLWRMSVRAGEVSWVRGLEYGLEEGGGFGRERRSLQDGGIVEIGAGGRSTERALPWMTLASDAGTWFGGVMWSGAWRMVARHEGSGVTVEADQRDLETTVRAGQRLELPHGFFGVVAGGEADVSAAMRAFLVDGLRAGRPYPALVTYNTWFVHGTRVDAEVIERELDRAAELGVELFQLDAGWYEGAGETGVYDFTSGLGSWRVDGDRFPGGLRALADRAHARGLRFGVWVEPERVDRRTVDRPGLAREEWLATSGGQYEPGIDNARARAAQVCLVHPAARQWVWDRLVELIEREGPDYLKWDNNAWLNCTREGHGHGPGDGGFAHVRALYDLMAALRARFPGLLIENCAGGGRRLDLGMAALTDAAWMDDRTTPSAHVRHNLEGLSSLLPPAYLLSYAMGSEAEPLGEEHDLALLIRSRMPGVLGLSYRSADLSAADARSLAYEVGVYKDMRGHVPQGSGVLLTGQASAAGSPPWDVVQVVSPSGAAGVFAYQNDGDVSQVQVRLEQLDPDALYEIVSVDRGLVGHASGASLMETGLSIVEAPGTAAAIFRLTPVASAAAGSLAHRP